MRAILVSLSLALASACLPKKEQTKAPQQQATQYICPMHPQVTSHKPGSCPICGMDLVAAQAKPTKQETSLKISLRQQQLIGIKTATVAKKELFKTIRAPGQIAFDPELYTAQSEYLEALRQWRKVRGSTSKAVRENTRQMIRSSKIRLKVLGLSEGQIKSLAKKGSQSEGLLVSGKGQESWVYAEVFETDLPHLKAGQSAHISANFLGGKHLSGKVVSLDQVISAQTRTAKVRIRLTDAASAIRPQSYVSVAIFAPLGTHLAIPLESIVDTGRETYVFVKKDEGEFSLRKVGILLETDTDAAIASGLSAQEEVVVGGNFMLDSESRLKSLTEDNHAH